MRDEVETGTAAAATSGEVGGEGGSEEEGAGKGSPAEAVEGNRRAAAGKDRHVHRPLHHQRETDCQVDGDQEQGGGGAVPEAVPRAVCEERRGADLSRRSISCRSPHRSSCPRRLRR